MTDLHALITELADELDHNHQCLLDDRRLTHPLADKARAALAEPEPEVEPTLREEFTMILNEARCNSPGRVIGNIELGRRLTAAVDRFRRVQPEPDGPTDEEILELMPQQFQDDLATVSRMAAYGAGKDIKPGVFRVSLNTGALNFARAVLARWGRSPQI